jgi:hypothetical protein
MNSPRAPFGTRPLKWALLICLLLPLHCAAEQYVQLTAEMEMEQWDLLLLGDRVNEYPGPNTPSIFRPNHTFRCVVGANIWMIEHDWGKSKSKSTYWFTGTNMVEHRVQGEVSSTRTEESVDGNPGCPGGVADRLFDCPARICWLAFCSGPALKREGSRLFPPSDLWKESRLAYTAWTNTMTSFSDDLALPRSVRLFTASDQSVIQYQTHQSTNILGWNFPLEFYLVQYQPSGTNNWQLHLTAKCRVTAIGPGTKPEIPPEALKAINKSTAQK